MSLIPVIKYNKVSTTCNWDLQLSIRIHRKQRTWSLFSLLLSFSPPFLLVQTRIVKERFYGSFVENKSSKRTFFLLSFSVYRKLKLMHGSRIQRHRKTFFIFYFYLFVLTFSARRFSFQVFLKNLFWIWISQFETLHPISSVRNMADEIFFFFFYFSNILFEIDKRCDGGEMEIFRIFLCHSFCLSNATDIIKCERYKRFENLTTFPTFFFRLGEDLAKETLSMMKSLKILWKMNLKWIDFL